MIKIECKECYKWWPEFIFKLVVVNGVEQRNRICNLCLPKKPISSISSLHAEDAMAISITPDLSDDKENTTEGLPKPKVSLRDRQYEYQLNYFKAWKPKIPFILCVYCGQKFQDIIYFDSHLNSHKGEYE